MTILERWRVHTTPAHVEETSVGGHRVGVGWSGWLRSAPVVAGAPFVLSPEFEYDVRLNGFFASARMRSLAERTQHGYARDLAAFLTFLWSARARRRWNQAREEDHLSYLHWRRHDGQGPRVSGSTWNRELAAVNQFYRWAVAAGYVEVSPVLQHWRRPGAARAGWASRSTLDEQRPATYSRDIGPTRVSWIPIANYRVWRDIGVRGFDTDGLPRMDFRGRWSSRDAAFCDLMIRTGLRLGEQSALAVAEFPLARDGMAYHPFELPAAIAKGGSGRTVYVPAAVAAEVAAYVRCDRAEVVEQARSAGRYARIRDPLVIDRHSRGGVLLARDRSGRAVRVANLPWEVRRRLLVETEQGLEPATLWLGEHGLPLSVARWKKMFAEANARCRAVGVALAVHAHMLRHSFAVITLEQLQRDHLAALGSLDPAQRGQYMRVFGDPLDWVRRRLGHRSVVTTQIYLHTLAELDMETRLALVPDDCTDAVAQPTEQARP
jgi:site-specific recombinase XerD